MKEFIPAYDWLSGKGNLEKGEMADIVKHGHRLKLMKDAADKLYEKFKKRIVKEYSGKDWEFDTDGVTLKITRGTRYEYGTPTDLVRLLHKEGKQKLADSLLDIKTTKVKETLGTSVLKDSGFMQEFPGGGNLMVKFATKK